MLPRRTNTASDGFSRSENFQYQMMHCTVKSDTRHCVEIAWPLNSVFHSYSKHLVRSVLSSSNENASH
jgi:hypothetical protein